MDQKLMDRICESKTVPTVIGAAIVVVTVVASFAFFQSREEAMQRFLSKPGPIHRVLCGED